MEMERVNPPWAEYARVIPIGLGIIKSGHYCACKGEVWLRYSHTNRGELNTIRMVVLAVNPTASKGVAVTYWRERKCE